MAKRGRPLQYGKTVTFRMNPATITRLQILSERWGMTRSEAVREMVARAVFETFDARERAERGIS